MGCRYRVRPVEQSNHLASEKCGLSFWMILTITRVMTICAPRMAYGVDEETDREGISIAVFISFWVN